MVLLSAVKLLFFFFIILIITTINAGKVVLGYERESFDSSSLNFLFICEFHMKEVN